MEAIVRTVTCTGPRVLPAHQARGACAHGWVERPGYRGLGRYVPETAAAAEGDAQADHMLSEIDEVLAEQKASAASWLPAKRTGVGGEGAHGGGGGGKANEPGAAAAVRLEAAAPRITTQTADVEVNLQLGEFSLRRQALTPLLRDVKGHPDLWPPLESTGPIQSVQVSATSNRRWLRLVGERRPAAVAAGRPTRHRRHPRLAAQPSALSVGVAAERVVDQQAIGPRGRAICRASRSHSRPPRYPMGPSPFSPASAGAGAPLTTARRAAAPPEPRREAGGRRRGAAVQQRRRRAGRRGRRRGLFVARRRREHAQGDCRAADPPTIHVYNVVECGRHFRSIVFSSDAAHCLHALSPRRQEQRATSHVQRVMGSAALPAPPAPSLVISRQISAALGEQTYLPGRLLHGLLPTALLEMYDLWQQADDSQLRGYMRAGASVAGDTRRTELRITLFPQRSRALPPEATMDRGGDGGRGGGGGGKSAASAENDDDGLGDVQALIQRVHLIEHDTSGAGGGAGGSAGQRSDRLWRRRPDRQRQPGRQPRKSANPVQAAAAAAAAAAIAAVSDDLRPTLTLLNLLLAPKGSLLRRLGRMLSRLDDMSHTLVWSSTPAATPSAACAVELVELPRLHLTFRARKEAGELRLFCEQHEGLFISNRRSPEVDRLLQGCPTRCCSSTSPAASMCSSRPGPAPSVSPSRTARPSISWLPPPPPGPPRRRPPARGLGGHRLGLRGDARRRRRRERFHLDRPLSAALPVGARPREWE